MNASKKRKREPQNPNQWPSDKINHKNEVFAMRRAVEILKDANAGLMANLKWFMDREDRRLKKRRARRKSRGKR